MYQMFQWYMWLAVIANPKNNPPLVHAVAGVLLFVSLWLYPETTSQYVRLASRGASRQSGLAYTTLTLDGQQIEETTGWPPDSAGLLP